MSAHKPIRWTVEAASREFGCSRTLLASRIAGTGVLAGADNKYATTDICRAVFGDIESEKLRLVREQADSQAIKNAALRRELLPAEDVRAHFATVLVALKSGILASGQSKEEKADLINNLRRLIEPIHIKNEHRDAIAEEDDADTNPAS